MKKSGAEISQPSSKDSEYANMQCTNLKDYDTGTDPSDSDVNMMDPQDTGVSVQGPGKIQLVPLSQSQQAGEILSLRPAQSSQ